MLQPKACFAAFGLRLTSNMIRIRAGMWRITASTRLRHFAVAVLVPWSAVSHASEVEPAKARWERFVAVAGHEEPIPEQWLTDEESRITHSLRPPLEVERTVPFVFKRAKMLALLPRRGTVGEQYFRHLCDTEAGEWILEVAGPQAGLYNARPTRRYSTAELQARFALEAPAIARTRHNTRDSAFAGAFLLMYPVLPYEFIEEPRREVDWQSLIHTPYVRLFGAVDDPETGVRRDMQVAPVEAPSARVAITWRGTRRELDREHSISGVELIVYERETGKVLAFRRQFLYAPPYKTVPESNSWLQADQCQRLVFSNAGREAMVRLPLFVAPPIHPMRWKETELIAPLPKRR